MRFIEWVAPDGAVSYQPDGSPEQWEIDRWMAEGPDWVPPRSLIAQSNDFRHKESSPWFATSHEHQWTPSRRCSKCGIPQWMT